MARVDCSNVEVNLKNCTCTYEPCGRKGVCCQCLLYHREKGELPGCFFPPEVEKIYDRSIQRFLSIHK
ncbi:DUF6485 family protein [Candidatus Hecatella orcuttiae]|uniref:DUF6485 family protein n=1 Tax=Candidatus Hecatella orcuttiae TaxID=1935119 RepID=UPI002867E19E|nr:DUF6485 family protein [Candidatus Hecatella orcuttiae]